MIDINLPCEVRYIINILENNGHEAYAVGGCVRDILLGKNPSDWDICTSAFPEQTMKYFNGQHIIETGLKHGTVTLMLNHKPFEITTYRIDGVYSDNRRPDRVEFTNDLKEDLSRRDFTINAMAYNPNKGIIDFFGGVKDLNDGIIKCVGNADKRFQEDALRIMRALRFAAVLGFRIESGTSTAMFDNKNLLNNIAVERIAAELNKLITGNGVKDILLAHFPVICEIIPELTAEQDVVNHILISVDNSPKDINIRLTILFKNINKSPEASSDTARKILSRLKYDNATVRTVTQLILYHDADIQPQKKYIKRWLNKIGEERLRQLIEVKKAEVQNTSNVLENILSLIDEIIERRECFSLKGLAVNGKDLIEAGIHEGSEIGSILKRLTDMVIAEQIENDKNVLLKYAGGQQMREQAEQNKIAWEYRAYEARANGNTVQEKAKEILDNPKSFLRYHQKYFDNIVGKRIANVCGSDGRRTIPFAVLGAEATLFDISEPQIKYALELAEAVGVKLECVLGDFCETDITKYGNTFDFVYMEGGILHYFSDIDVFTKILYAITKPNGRLIICDAHPYRKINGLKYTDGDYFDSRFHNEDAPLRTVFPEEEQTAFPKISVRYYTISEIINSVIDSGFTLKEFIEHPHYKEPKRPMEFTIVADKFLK